MAVPTGGDDPKLPADVKHTEKDAKQEQAKTKIPRPKSPAKSKVDDVLKELNTLRKELKKDEL